MLRLVTFNKVHATLHSCYIHINTNKFIYFAKNIHASWIFYPWSITKMVVIQNTLMNTLAKTLTNYCLSTFFHIHYLCISYF